MKPRLILASSLAALLAIAPAVSAAPVAEARGNELLTKYVEVNKTVTLDGSGSYGADCDLSYSWTMVSRPAGSGAGISAPTSVQPTFVPDRVGDYVIDLAVADSIGTSSPARITVSAINGSEWPLPAKNADRWMTLTPKMMDRTLPEITLPGTHDSGAYWLDTDHRGPDFDDWSYDLGPFGDVSWDSLENEVGYDLARTHDYDLLGQLSGGIRYLDLRVTSRRGVFYVYHGLLGRPLTTVLQDIRTFMEQSEHELVVVGISHLKTGTNRDNAQAFTAPLHQSLMQLLVDVDQLGPYLYPRNGHSTADLLAARLGQIVGDGSRVLLIYADSYLDSDASRADPNSAWFWPKGFAEGGSYRDTTSLSEQRADQLGKARVHSQSGSAMGFTLFQTLTADYEVGKANAICRVSFGAVCDSPRTLRQLSRTVNPALPAMLAEMAQSVRPSVVLVDHYQESAVVSEAIRLNQRDTRAPTSQATRVPPANRYGGSFGDVTVTLTAADEAGGSGVRGILVTTEGAQPSSGEYCGARKEVVVKAKGVTTVKYRPSDREGNMPQWQSLVVRTDQKCDFNRDGKTDAADRSGLLNSVRDRSIMFLGDLDEDGRYTSQEWMRCWYHLYYRRPL